MDALLIRCKEMISIYTWKILSKFKFFFFFLSACIFKLFEILNWTRTHQGYWSWSTKIEAGTIERAQRPSSRNNQ